MNDIPLEALPDHVGALLGHSPWKTVSQDMIQAFADATGDHQWIHVDGERARRDTPWHSTVAHGFLTVSLIPVLNQAIFQVTGTSASINYGMNKLRFPAAVRAGSAIRSRVTLEDVSTVDHQRTLATFSTRIEIQGEDRPACVAQNLAMYLG